MKNIIITFVILGFFTGCYSYKKADRHVYKAGRYYPGLTAAYCAERYPPLSFVKDSVIYKPGKNEQVFVYANCDTIKKTGHTSSLIKLACPACVIDTMYIYREKQVVNKAEIEQLRLVVNDMVIEKAVLQRNNKLLFHCVIILSVYTILRWILRMWKINLF